MEAEFAVILNFETSRVECLSLEHRESDIDAEDYIEDILEYRLHNCQWMVVIGEPQIERLNY